MEQLRPELAGPGQESEIAEQGVVPPQMEWILSSLWEHDLGLQGVHPREEG